MSNRILKFSFSNLVFRNILFIVLLTIISRFMFFESFFYGYDSVNYALGSTDFSLINTRPHLPGSIFFINALSAINIITHDAHLSFKFLNIFFSVIAAIFTYLSFNKLFKNNFSFALTIFLLFNPMAWFYSCVTEVYVFDWFLGSILLYSVFSKNGVYYIPIIISIGMGFRQSSGVLLAPIFFYLIYVQKDINWKKIVFSIFFSMLIVITWLYPIICNSGGIKEYIDLYTINNPMEQISIFQNIYRLSSLILYFIIPPLLFLLLTKSNMINSFFRKAFKDSDILKILVITIPPILFFVFSHYSKGYILLIATPLFALLGILTKNIKNNKIIYVFTIIEILLFIFLPTLNTALETKVKPEYRKYSYLDTWINRTFSEYHLGFQNILRRDNQIASFNTFIKDRDEEKYFLSPMFSGIGRALQIEHPNIQFNSIDIHSSKKFILFNNIDVSIINREINDPVYFLFESKELYSLYFRKARIVNYQNGIYLLYLTRKEFLQYLDFCDTLFTRD